MRLTILTAVMLGSAFAPPIMPAKAEDASWGCQVLLCAASQNPSWHGVPLLRPTHDQADCGHEGAGVFVANLS
ncbi:hypothetical protein ABID08_005259 [Rhizobium binae]|uniref:Uncharacterized protein n=1 Tax=Rhizobium binae TaxID=1138190 RepID=A0ABV2MN48_9HYPH